MENIIIKDCPVIKEVILNKKCLTSLKESIQSKHLSLAEFDTEISNIKDSIRSLENDLFKLESDKKEIEQLILEGNSALSSKLIHLSKDISKKKNEIEELENNINYMLDLKESQKNKLEKDIYNKFLDSGSLQSEFDSNAKKLQLKLYSLLYKAFEVETQLKNLESEYQISVEDNFEFKPLGSFTNWFPALSYINPVRQNFDLVGKHYSAYNPDDIDTFVKELEGFKGNEEILIYK